MTRFNTDLLHDLTIRNIEAFGVCLPMNKTVLMAGVEISQAESLLIRLETNCGLIGWGEATSAPNHGGATLPEMLQSFNEEIRSAVLGKNAAQLSQLTKLLMHSTNKGKSTVAAVDLALFDVVAKYLKVPAYMLLGGKQRDYVSPLWLIGNKHLEEDVLEVEKKMALGYRFFKLKLGVKSLQGDIDLAYLLREKFGQQIQLCADANMGMNLTQAMEYVSSIKDAHVEYLEQPLHKSDIDSLKTLLSMSPVPIGLDESVTDISEILESAKMQVQGVSLKTLKLGGMSGVTSAGHVCDALSLKINLAGKIAETSIASAALLQLSAVLPNVDWGVSPSHLYLEHDIVQTQQLPSEGHFYISDTPGLGIEVDEGLVRSHQVT